MTQPQNIKERRVQKLKHHKCAFKTRWTHFYCLKTTYGGVFMFIWACCLLLKSIKLCLLRTFTPNKTPQRWKVSNSSATKSVKAGGEENSPPDQLWPKLSSRFLLTPQIPAPWRRPTQEGWRVPPGEQRPSSVSSWQAQERSWTLKHRETTVHLWISQLLIVVLISTASLRSGWAVGTYFDSAPRVLSLCRIWKFVPVPLQESFSRWDILKCIHVDRALWLHLELTQFKKGNHFVNNILQLPIGSERQKNSRNFNTWMDLEYFKVSIFYQEPLKKILNPLKAL